LIYLYCIAILDAKLVHFESDLFHEEICGLGRNIGQEQVHTLSHQP